MSDAESQLLQFLRKPAPPGLSDPPALPTNLQNLPAAVYVKAALAYVEYYPFARTFSVYTPQQHEQKEFTPDPQWQEKSRAVLIACISTDRDCLVALDPQYDASKHQLQFVHEHVFNRRWSLEEVASEMRALFQLIRSRTRTASAVSTPMDTSLPRKKTVVDQVRERDDKCRLTGVEREKSGPEGEDQRRRRAAMDTLQVVHCLPYKTGNTSFHLLEALAGVNFTGWQADSVENAFLARLSIHELFAAFKIFFEWTLTANGDVEIIIRGRTGPADPFFFLQTLRDDHGQPCDLIIGKPLRARHNTAIADIDEKFFVLHKYIGDIVWMSGGAEPVPDSDEDDDEGMKVLSNNNVGTVMEKLRSPEMDMLPRQREGIFHPIVELVPKQLVWAN